MPTSTRLVFLLAPALILWAMIMSVLPAHAENRILGLRSGMFENAARLVIETSDEVEVSFFLLSIPTGLLSTCRHHPGR